MLQCSSLFNAVYRIPVWTLAHFANFDYLRSNGIDQNPVKLVLITCISLLVIVLFHLFTQATATRTPFSSTSRVSRGCAVRTSTATSRSCGSWARPVCFSFPLFLCIFLGRPLTCVKVTVSAHEAPRKTAQKSSEHTLEA